jgi:hypothetical protein
MGWRVVSLPPSVASFLRKRSKADYSPAQKARAAVRHFARLPLWRRIQLAREYLACQGDRPSTREGPDPRGR